jgi:hypothetical protein
MVDFGDTLRNIADLGVLEYLSPFVLIFTIVFAILQKTKILGTEDGKKPKRNFNVILAFVMGMATVIPHATGAYPQGMDPVNIINGALPQVSLVVVAILMLLLLIGAWGKNFDIGASSFGGFVVIASILIVVYIFGSQAGWWYLPGWLSFISDSTTQATVITILVFGVIIWFVTKEDKPKDEKDKSLFEKLSAGLKEEGKS